MLFYCDLLRPVSVLFYCDLLRPVSVLFYCDLLRPVSVLFYCDLLQEAFTFLAQSTISVSAPEVPLVVGTEFRDQELSIRSAVACGKQLIEHASTRTNLADKSTAST